jgi:hypothetical protein
MKTTIAAMALSICAAALTACTSVKVLDGVEIRCARSPAGKITAKEGELWVNDNMIKVCRGDSVRWTFRPPMPAASAARILPKDAGDGWLMGTFNGTEIVINVPTTVRPTGEGTPYGYIIEVDGVGRLDPRLVVQ